MLKLTFLLFIIIATPSLIAQESRTLITGNIKSEGAELENIHILNKNSKKGSITDSKGNFTLAVKEKDTIIITGIQFYYLEVPITREHVTNKFFSIDLLQKTNVLEEVEVKHNLTGNITADSDKIKISKNIEDGVLDFSKIDLNIVDIRIDASTRSRTSSDDQLMPNRSLDLKAIAGMILKPIIKEVVKIGATTRNIKKYERRFENKVLEAPQNIRIDFGDTFFTETLKIPTNHIDEFIVSCLPKGIARLYVDNKKIEIIDLLLTESKTYLELIKSEE